MRARQSVVKYEACLTEYKSRSNFNGSAGCSFRHHRTCNMDKYTERPVPVAARSKAWVYGRSPAEIVGLNPTGAWMFVCCECCVLSGRVLCDGLITLPEESYRLWRVVVCDKETSNEEAKAR